MNLGLNSVHTFSPVDPDLWEVAFTLAEVDPWTLPVIGFATVITAEVDGDQAGETVLLPVVLDDTDGMPSHLYQYLQHWDQPRPDWTMRRKAKG